ncbi:MAG: hypothetical protein NT175_00520 [Bacteroidetes bacterium]|nr:hypothetical protein [Bacteroidota bacterium]
MTFLVDRLDVFREEAKLFIINKAMPDGKNRLKKTVNWRFRLFYAISYRVHILNVL